MSQIIPYLAPGALTNTQSDVTDLQSLSGRPDNSVDHGTFTGITIPDNQTTNQALQALETEVEDRLPDFVRWGIGKGPGYASNAAASNISTSSFWQRIGLQDFTVTADIRVDASGYYQVVSKPSTTEVQIVKASSTITTVVIGSQSYNFTSPALAAYSYHNITFVADRDGNGKLFTDGELTSTVDISSSSGQNLTGTIQCFAGQSSYQVGHRLQILNRAVTDAEAVLLSRGQRLGFADVGATGAASYTSDFSVDTNGWANSAGSTVSRVAGPIGGESDVLLIQADTSTGAHQAAKSNVFQAGKRYRVSASFYMPSANTDGNGVTFIQGAVAGVNYYSDSNPTKDQWNSFEVEFVAAGTSLQDQAFIRLTSNGSTTFTDAGGDDKIYIKDIVVTPIGEVLSLLPEGAAPAIWADASNGYNGTVTGATLINPMPLHADEFVSLTNLPTSSAGLATGQVWNDSGTLKIV